MQALGFDKTDLQVNQNGRITTRQKRRVLSLFGLKFVAVVVGLLLIFTVGVNLIPRLGTIHLWTTGDWVLLIFGMIFGTGSIYAVWGIAYDLILGKCTSTTGTVSVEYTFDQKLGPIANLKVKDSATGKQHDFEIFTHAFPIRQGSLMRVYFTPGTATLIGIEDSVNPNKQAGQ
jgi:hypothetical protein